MGRTTGHLLSAEPETPQSLATPLMPEPRAARLESRPPYHVHSAERDDLLDDLTRLAAEVCGAPGALLSVVGFERVQHVSRFGASFGDTASEDALVLRAILAEGLFVVSDTLNDTRLTRDGVVSNAIGIRFYGGAPLI